MVVFRRRQRNRSYTQIGQIVAIDRGEQPCYRDCRFQVAEKMTTGSAGDLKLMTDSAGYWVRWSGQGTCRAVELKTTSARESLALEWLTTLGGCGYACDRGRDRIGSAPSFWGKKMPPVASWRRVGSRRMNAVLSLSVALMGSFIKMDAVFWVYTPLSKPTLRPVHCRTVQA